MNILIAIDSFKGSLTTTELAETISKGITDVSDKFKVQKTPIADGGEGTYKTLVQGLGGKTIVTKVSDPLFNEITAEYGILPDKTAVIEMAQSSGLPLVPKQLRNPMNTTTYGVGELIKDAIFRGVRSFIIGIGGSATNDAGIGMLSALGFKFKDALGNELKPVGSSLLKIKEIDSSGVLNELDECEFLVACDVDNPLYGNNGAAFVYAKQKGASLEDIIELDKGLENFGNVVLNEKNIDISNVPGSGAAGGLGGGFLGFLNAKLESGTKIIFNKLDIENKVKNADIIITGEGKLDFQSIMGKAPIGVAKLAKKYDKIVIAFAGSITEDAIAGHDYGITSMFSIIDSPMTLENAMKKDNALKLLYKQTNELFRLIYKISDFPTYLI
jgi:glycerate kinase